MVISKIFFFHNPKAAGTAVAEQLKRNFCEEQCCPNIENDALEHRANGGSYERFRGFSLYTGHYGADIYKSVEDGHVPITNFRNPVDRIVSLYNYFRYSVNIPDSILQMDKYFAVRAAKTYEFCDYISLENSAINIYISNQHFRQLVNSGWSLDSCDDLSPARQLIDAMPWFYISEYPIQSCRWARDSLAWDLPKLPVVNETKVQDRNHVKSGDLNSRDRRIILDKNTRDFTLFEYAVNRLLKS